MESVSAAVAEWVEASGLSAASVARKAGVSASTMHRILNGLVDPGLGTVTEIAIACGRQATLSTSPLSDPRAARAAREMLEPGYPAAQDPGTGSWRQRLGRIAGSQDPVAIVQAAARAAMPLCRPGTVLLHGDITLARLASAGDAAPGDWAISGAAGLYLPSFDATVPPVTILWCEDVRTATHLLADSGLRQTRYPERASVAIAVAEAELFSGVFDEGIVRYAAPLQIMLDCLAQDGAVAAEALEEVRSW